MTKPNMSDVMVAVAKRDHNLRVGQWFMNTYYPHMVNNELYYCADANIAWKIILNLKLMIED